MSAEKVTNKVGMSEKKEMEETPTVAVKAMLNFFSLVA